MRLFEHVIGLKAEHAEEFPFLGSGRGIVDASGPCRIRARKHAADHPRGRRRDFFLRPEHRLGWIENQYPRPIDGAVLR